VNDSPWVTSLGGPLILIPESGCPLWGGAPPPSYPEVKGDYDRACTVDDYIGLIEVGTAHALVLSAPEPTTFLPDRGLLVQSIAADDDFDLIEVLDQLLPTIDWQEQLIWSITEPVILFDAVYSFAEVITDNEEHLQIDLLPGRYVVEAAYLKIPDTAWLVLIRLTGPEAA
jgi:hypothetical protein